MVEVLIFDYQHLIHLRVCFYYWAFYLIMGHIFHLFTCVPIFFLIICWMLLIANCRESILSDLSTKGSEFCSGNLFNYRQVIFCPFRLSFILGKDKSILILNLIHEPDPYSYGGCFSVVTTESLRCLLSSLHSSWD